VSKEKGKKDLNWLRRVSSFAPARIILTANNFRIFDHLGKGKTADAVSKALSTDKRATGLLLNSLTAIGLLKKEGNRYRNSSVASRYLVKGKTDYQGDILSHYDVLWDNWSGLDTVLKTGKPQRRSHDHRSFILGMHNLALQKVDKVIGNINLEGVRRVLDLGGGPGTYSMAFAKKGMDVTLFDYPDTLKISRKLIKEAGLGRNIRLLPGDFTENDWGRNNDMVFISQIFHAYGPEACIAMLEKCYDSLTPGGRVVVQEFHLDGSRTSPTQGALFAINMLVNTPAGRTYTAKEISSWMKKTGFTSISHKVLDDTVLISGTKKRVLANQKASQRS
jgi:ubiquinone/menaquinone biosynthesis C-methylase UbiE